MLQSTVRGSRPCVARPAPLPRVTPARRSLLLRCHATTAKVSLKLPMSTKLGESLLVVGSAPALGAWDAAKGAPLEWTEGSIWTSDVDLPVGEAVEYKYVIRRPGGVTWQAGSNNVLNLPERTLTAVVCDTWEGARQSLQLSQAEVLAESAVTETQAASDSMEAVAGTTMAAVAQNEGGALAPEEELVAVAAIMEALNAVEASNPTPTPANNPLDKIKEEIEKFRLALAGRMGEKGGLATVGLLSMLGIGSTSVLLALLYVGKTLF